MKLSEIYEEMIIIDAWNKLEEAFNETALLSEGNARLDKLIKESEKAVFENFGIDTGDKKYFIAGSARLYLYPGLVEVINELSSEISEEKMDEIPIEPGDLDIIIPLNPKLWETLKNNVSDKLDDAGDEYSFNDNLEKGIFRPQKLGLTQMDIEVFKEWNPSKAGGEYASTVVGSPKEIFSRASKFNGYYYMSMFDVINYKFQMDRPKEKRIAAIINDYLANNAQVAKDKNIEPRSEESLLKILSRVIRMRYNPTSSKE
jgi:hypothetical protein